MDVDVLEAELTGLGGEVDDEKRGREKATRITSWLRNSGDGGPFTGKGKTGGG